MKKQDKEILDHLHEQTMPKIKTFREYKTAYSLAMATIIHLEANYKDFSLQMKSEIYQLSNKETQEQLKDLGDDISLK